jgi:hypothetical protein
LRLFGVKTYYVRRLLGSLIIHGYSFLFKVD